MWNYRTMDVRVMLPEKAASTRMERAENDPLLHTGLHAVRRLGIPGFHGLSRTCRIRKIPGAHSGQPHLVDGWMVVRYVGLPSLSSRTITDLFGEPFLSSVNLPVTPLKDMPEIALRICSRVGFLPAFS